MVHARRRCAAVGVTAQRQTEPRFSARSPEDWQRFGRLGKRPFS
jgi:hypothetical protein